MYNKIKWPNNKDFAFTVFDDTDLGTINNLEPIYSLLDDFGYKTTKSVWPVKSKISPLIGGSTCQDEKYLNWVKNLKIKGFEIALHNVTNSSSIRADTIKGMEKYFEY